MLEHRHLVFKGRAPAPGASAPRFRVCRCARRVALSSPRRRPNERLRPCPFVADTSPCQQARPTPAPRKTPSAQPYRIPHRHFWAPWSQPHRSPGGRLPVPSRPSTRRLPRARPVVGQFQHPRLRFATVRAGVARPSLPPCARSVASLAQASTMPQHQPENSHVRHHFRPGHTRP